MPVLGLRVEIQPMGLGTTQDWGEGVRIDVIWLGGVVRIL